MSAPHTGSNSVEVQLQGELQEEARTPTSVLEERERREQLHNVVLDQQISAKTVCNTTDQEIFMLKIIRVKIFCVDKNFVVPFDPQNFSA